MVKMRLKVRATCAIVQEGTSTYVRRFAVNSTEPLPRLAAHRPRMSVVADRPRGILAARKLRNMRHERIWRDRTYKRRPLSNIYGTSRTVHSSYGTGIELETVGVEAKHPNSATRRGLCAPVTNNGNQATVFSFVPTDGCVDLSDNSDVLISAKHKRGDLLRLAHFKVVKVSGVGILSKRRMSR
ncbi:hypothetical protein DFH07DRAFT_514778 [Mycena maculata]|uniref:Uncharacterized protein n=1 Tax=Mycena maculata TaxID=230809 RepID=A0AAD7IYI8_9AGAR|nr:hypothetical protein DFH07DRAFT_514778 [Mycena maculata]